MKRARREPSDPSSRAAGTALELLVHGVGGASAPELLNDPRTVRVTGDDTAAVHRRADDLDAEIRRDRGEGPVPEAYVWSNLTSGSGARALWLLLLPFMVVNLAHWMRPAAVGRPRAVRAYALCVRLAALTLTVLLVAAVCEVALDLAAWQCAGVRDCAAERAWLAFFSPELSPGGWWTPPGRRLVVAALLPTALTALLWYLSRRTWRAYESQEPPEPDEDPAAGPHDARESEPRSDPGAERGPLTRPGFWYGRRLVARLRAAHTAAALLTVAATITAPALRFDRRHDGPAALDLLGAAVGAIIAVVALLTCAVVCRRGRSERRLDRELDGPRVRFLPVAAAGALVLSAGYASWSRPGWSSEGRLLGDQAFGALMVVQWALVLALAVIARILYRTAPAPRTVLGGLAGPAVTVVACALAGVLAGGGAQRAASWLDVDTGPAVGGPPVLLGWHAAVLVPLLLVVLAVLLGFGVGAVRRTGTEVDGVRTDYPDEEEHRPSSDSSQAGPEDTDRARAIARARSWAELTDRAPAVIGTLAAGTLVCGAGALLGAWVTREPPGRALSTAPEPLARAVELAQEAGSWLAGAGFLLLALSARRAYRDPKARRTIGILWDVGTFWPRAAHPFAPPCYAERAVPDLIWRVQTWTRRTRGRLVLSGHSQGSVLAAAAAWQLAPDIRGRVALLTYGSPLERLYGRWFPSCFGPESLAELHRDVHCWRNLHRRTDPIGGPVLLAGEHGRAVDGTPLQDPLAYGRTPGHPLPAPILGHFQYQADPAFAEARARLLDRLQAPVVPAARHCTDRGHHRPVPQARAD
ncbi:hypothetical protein [Streptomyces sp. NPDC049906]|uniref:hypothetical protein n=1 Tax=Streptomyces sp. NPDC049906 TaxID=3155656 RepID=UPI00341E7F11